MIVDSDSHINEPLEIFERFLEEPYTSRRPTLVKDTLGLTRILMEGRLFPETRLRQIHTKGVEGPKLAGIRPGAQDAKTRLADLDLEGIDTQVILGSISLPLSTLPDKDFAAAMCRACNDFYADFASENPDRLKPLATLPVQDVPAAIDELKRTTQELGHIGVAIPPNVNGKNLDHPDFYPLYAEAQSLGVPIAVHWGNGSYIPAAGTERFDTHFMVHAIGHPFEQMIALACFITGGILEQFPRLRVAFLEGGCGWLAFWLQRLDEHYERRAPELPLMKKPPSEYFKDGNCFVAAESGENMLAAVIEKVGDDGILFGSDYPHSDSKFPNAVKFVRERSDVSEASKEKLFTNGASWLGLEA